MLSFDDLIPGKSSLSFDDLVPKKDPKIGQPEELTFAEKYVAPALEALGLGEQGVAGKAGISRGGAVGRLAQGAADPGVAIAQLAANAVGQGDAVNKRIADVEQEYRGARKANGSEGFDPLRAVGATGMSLVLPGMAGAGTGVVRGAVQGGVLGALEPVRDGGENFWSDKGKQAGVGAGAGAVLSPLMGALARVVSPKASTNADLALLKSEGVNPSIGQALGGWANTLEEKASSLPIVGDAITGMRRKAVEQFNEAAINRAVAPVGGKVSGAGHEAVAEAGDILSSEYRKALGSVNHVNFNTPAFNQQFGQLQQMATGLSEPMQKRFNAAVNDVVLRKMSPNGSILGADLKAVDSELGQIVRRYGRSSVASEQELADAVKQLQAVVRDGVKDGAPAVAGRLRAADAGWANLVRVENAAKRGVNAEGVFTPGQLNYAVRGSDSSVRGRAAARGEALMQELSSAGQSVLGNKYPDSGTAGRLLTNAAGIGTAMAHPAIPMALAGAATLYARPIQNALVELIRRRPQDAPRVANYLRQLASPATVAAVPLAEQGTR